MMALERKVDAVNAMIANISHENFPLCYIIMFGSVLTDNFDENSDLDICFIHDDDIALTHEEQNAIERFFRQSVGNEVELDYIYATLSTFFSGQDVFESIRNEGVVLWKRTGA